MLRRIRVTEGDGAAPDFSEGCGGGAGYFRSPLGGVRVRVIRIWRGRRVKPLDRGTASVRRHHEGMDFGGYGSTCNADGSNSPTTRTRSASSRTTPPSPSAAGAWALIKNAASHKFLRSCRSGHRCGLRKTRHFASEGSPAARGATDCLGRARRHRASWARRRRGRGPRSRRSSYAAAGRG